MGPLFYSRKRFHQLLQFGFLNRTMLMWPALTLSDSKNQIGHSIYSFWHFLTHFLFLFQETYPSTPPVWFSESDNVNVTNALTSLSETSGINNHLSYQVKSLLRQLCTLFSLPLPVECTDSDSNSSGCSTGKKSYLLFLKFGENLVLIILKVWGKYAVQYCID